MIETVFFAATSIFFLYACHYLRLNTSGVGLQLPFNAMGWIPLSFAIGAGCLRISVAKELRYTTLSLQLGFCLLLLAIPLFYPWANPDQVTDRFLGLAAGFLLFLSLQQFSISRRKALNVLLLIVVAAWIEVIYSWDQFLRSFGYFTSATRGVWSGQRSGVFQQVNVLGSFVATGIVLSQYVLARHSEIEGRKFELLYIPLLLLPLFAIHVLNILGSRTAWLGFFIGAACCLPYLVKHAGRAMTGLWLASVVLGFALTSGIYTLTEESSPILEKANLTTARVIHYPQTIEMFLDKPLAGYGYGRFESAYLHYTADSYASGEMSEPGFAPLDHPHNEILFWALEGGLLGVAGLLMAAWFVFRRVIGQPWPQALALFAIFFPIVLHTQTEYPFYVSTAHWIIFVVLIYWTDHMGAQYRLASMPWNLFPGIAGVVIPVLTSVFMATTLYSGWILARFEFGLNPDVSSLFRINNPMVWNEKINWALRSRLVVTGIIQDKPEQIHAFIDFAHELIEHKPRQTFYRYLILAYHGVGDEENKRRYQEEAYYLFPNDTFEVEEFSGMLVENVPFEAISR